MEALTVQQRTAGSSLLSIGHRDLIMEKVFLYLDNRSFYHFLCTSKVVTEIFLEKAGARCLRHSHGLPSYAEFIFEREPFSVNRVRQNLLAWDREESADTGEMMRVCHAVERARRSEEGFSKRAWYVRLYERNLEVYSQEKARSLVGRGINVFGIDSSGIRAVKSLIAAIDKPGHYVQVSLDTLEAVVLEMQQAIAWIQPTVNAYAQMVRQCIALANTERMRIKEAGYQDAWNRLKPILEQVVQAAERVDGEFFARRGQWGVLEEAPAVKYMQEVLATLQHEYFPLFQEIDLHPFYFPNKGLAGIERCLYLCHKQNKVLFYIRQLIDTKLYTPGTAEREVKRTLGIKQQEYLHTHVYAARYAAAVARAAEKTLWQYGGDGQR